MAFLDLDDRSGRIQLQAKRDLLGEERMDLLLDLDLGDIVGIDGVVFMSRRGELSLRVEDFTVLAKSLRPPPDKHHGLADVETRYRRRELDLIANEEARELFIARAKIVTAVRRYLDDQGFVEVETPVLQPLYGGALAPPFTTHFNALDRTCTCGSRPSSTSSAASSAVSSASTSSARTSATRGSRPSTTPSSRWSSGTRPTRTTTTRCAGWRSVVRGRRRSGRLRGESTWRRRGGG